MNLDHYKELLLAKERELIAHRVRTSTDEQETGDGAARDAGDDAVEDEAQAALFNEDEADAIVLDDVRLALGRIADGSYGHCVVDDEPIDEKRLEAIPWARYCTKHQAELEETQGLGSATL